MTGDMPFDQEVFGEQLRDTRPGAQEVSVACWGAVQDSSGMTTPHSSETLTMARVFH